MRKYDIVNGLAPRTGHARYLEICTPSTGVKFGSVDGGLFAVRHRLMYRCPEVFEDGLPITFRTSAEGSHDLVRAMDATLREDDRYDVVFVDPWHGYAASIADMHGALCLLRPGGVMVVHDCNPTDADTVGSAFRAGAWCGVTYAAFIDFVLSSAPAGHCVVDSDYGCGVVFTAGGTAPGGLACGRPGRRTVLEWVLARDADATRYPVFDRYRQLLLNLVDPWTFADACGMGYPEPAAATGVPDLSSPPATSDPAMHLFVDGVEVPLQGYSEGWHRFQLPAVAGDIRLVSASAVPSESNPPSVDSRRLGLAVAGIKVGTRSIDLADPALAEGWHKDEAAAGYPWRWTDGNARLRLMGGTVVEVFTAGRAGLAAAG